MEKPGELAALILDFLADCRVCRQTGDKGSHLARFTGSDN